MLHTQHGQHVATMQITNGGGKCATKANIMILNNYSKVIRAMLQQGNAFLVILDNEHAPFGSPYSLRAIFHKANLL